MWLMIRLPTIEFKHRFDHVTHGDLIRLIIETLANHVNTLVLYRQAFDVDEYYTYAQQAYFMAIEENKLTTILTEDGDRRDEAITYDGYMELTQDILAGLMDPLMGVLEDVNNTVSVSYVRVFRIDQFAITLAAHHKHLIEYQPQRKVHEHLAPRPR